MVWCFNFIIDQLSRFCFFEFVPVNYFLNDF